MSYKINIQHIIIIITFAKKYQFKMKDQKDLYFKYIVFKLLEWHKETTNKEDISSFSRLKVLKLLFFVSAIKVEQTDDRLLDTFDNFYAMQYGPVESDIYDSIVKDQYSLYFTLSNREILKKAKFDKIPTEIDETEKKIIDSSLITLKERNKNIITYSPLELVELSHKWSSWQDAINMAKMLGKGSEKMTSSKIINDSVNKDYFII